MTSPLGACATRSPGPARTAVDVDAAARSSTAQPPPRRAPCGSPRRVRAPGVSVSAPRARFSLPAAQRALVNADPPGERARRDAITAQLLLQRHRRRPDLRRRTLPRRCRSPRSPPSTPPPSISARPSSSRTSSRAYARTEARPTRPSRQDGQGRGLDSRSCRDCSPTSSATGSSAPTRRPGRCSTRSPAKARAGTSGCSASTRPCTTPSATAAAPRRWRACS